MSNTKLQLKAQDTSGKSTTTSITYVNENATNANLLEFSQRLNNLTTNTYTQTLKIRTTELDTESDPSKQTNTITLSTDSTTLTNLKTRAQINKISATANANKAYISYISKSLVAGIWIENDSSVWLVIGTINQLRNDLTDNSTAGAIIITIPEDDTYNSASATFTITEG